MKKIYAYKGFEVTVELERTGDDGVWLLRPHGFVSVVHITSVGATGGTPVSISLTADGQRPFVTEVEALTAGCNAAQRLIDDNEMH